MVCRRSPDRSLSPPKSYPAPSGEVQTQPHRTPRAPAAWSLGSSLSHTDSMPSNIMYRFAQRRRRCFVCPQARESCGANRVGRQIRSRSSDFPMHKYKGPTISGIPLSRCPFVEKREAAMRAFAVQLSNRPCMHEPEVPRQEKFTLQMQELLRRGQRCGHGDPGDPAHTPSSSRRMC